jgi:hypothetical protein
LSLLKYSIFLEKYYNFHKSCSIPSFFSSIFGPSYAYLQIWLCKFDWNIFQISRYFLISCSKLACFKKITWKKKSPLKASIQTKNFTFPNGFYDNYHGIQIWPFIFDINNDFSSQPILIKKICQIIGQGLISCFYGLKQTNS